MNRQVSLGKLNVGFVPFVVGTLSSELGLPLLDHEVPCDIIEVRLDEFVDEQDWVSRCEAIESIGLPVILTIRLAAEGGKWSKPDKERLPLFMQALQHVSAVDVELKSEIVAQVSTAARDAGKACVISYHDFTQTPSFADLKAVVSKAQRLGSIVKISTMVRTDSDIEILNDLLTEKWDVPMSVIGMGAQGTQTRVMFAMRGSVLTYGYLDKPSAPGQLPSSTLVESLRRFLPKYNEEFVTRKQILEFA